MVTGDVDKFITSCLDGKSVSHIKSLDFEYQIYFDGKNGEIKSLKIGTENRGDELVSQCENESLARLKNRLKFYSEETGDLSDYPLETYIVSGKLDGERNFKVQKKSTAEYLNFN